MPDERDEMAERTPDTEPSDAGLDIDDDRPRVRDEDFRRVQLLKAGSLIALLVLLGLPWFGVIPLSGPASLVLLMACLVGALCAAVVCMRASRWLRRYERVSRCRFCRYPQVGRRLTGDMGEPPELCPECGRPYVAPPRDWDDQPPSEPWRGGL